MHDDYGVPCLTILNNKGGVGKTTLSSVVAEYNYFVQGKRVAILDWDGQLNLTKTYIGTQHVPGVGTMPIENPELLALAAGNPEILEHYNLRSTITDIFEHKEVWPYTTAFSQGEDLSLPRIDIIAGNQQGIRLLLESTPTEMKESPFAHLANVTTGDIIKHLVKFCALPELKEHYDLLIIDSGPSDNPLFEAALRAATHIVCPYVPESKSVSGIEGLLEALSRAQRARNTIRDRPEPLRFIGLLPNMLDSRINSHMQLMADTIESTGGNHFPPGLALRRLKAYSALTDDFHARPEPKSVFQLRDGDPAKDDALAVMEFMMANVFNEAEAAA